MADSICAPDAPPPAPSLATMAVATGAAIFAGAVLGRRGGIPGIAAGVAVIAGSKWLAKSRESHVESPCEEAYSATEDMAPEVHPPEVTSSQPDSPDWLEHDAVEFSHDVPDSAQAMEMLQEKELPLLDDDGLPVDSIDVTPAFPELLGPALPEPVAREPDPPPGPIIWKPGRFPQSSSNGTSETVWFGLQDPVKPPPPQASPEPVVSASTPPTAPAADESWPPPAAHSPFLATPLPQVPAESPDVPPADSSELFGGNPFLSSLGLQHHAPLSDSGDSATPASVVPFPGAAAPAVITAKATCKTALPQPRRAGELPKWHPGKATQGGVPAPVESPASPPVHAPPASLPATWKALQSSAEGAPHHHLAPRAPTDMEQPPRRWPLVVLLVLLILIGLFLTFDQWQGGGLVRRVKSLPVFHKQEEPGQTAGVPPGRAEPDTAPVPASVDPGIPAALPRKEN